MNKTRIREYVVIVAWGLGIFPFMGSAALADDLVRFPIGPANWTIAITQHPSPTPVKANSPAAVNLVRIEVTQDKEKTRTVMKYSNGETRSAWSFASLGPMLTEDPGGTVFFAPNSIPLNASAFAWLKPEFLQEKEPIEYGGTKCLHYQGKVTVPLSFPDQRETSVTEEAWIDCTTLLPVAFDDGTELAVFTFQQSPSDEPLILPPNYSKLLAIKKRILGLP